MPDSTPPSPNPAPDRVSNKPPVDPRVARRRKRVAILLITVAMVTGVLSTLYLMQRARQDAQTQKQRDTILAAKQADDFEAVLAALPDGPSAFMQDLPVLQAYAFSLLEAREDDRSAVAQAVMLLAQVAEQDPNAIEAARTAMGFLGATSDLSRQAQALNMANIVLAQEPDNLEAMTVRAQMLATLQRDEEALEAARALAQARPQDYVGHALMVRALSQSPTSPRAGIEYAQALVQEQPNDSAASLALAVAHAMANDPEAVIAPLQQAVQSPPRSTLMLNAAVQLMDQLGRYQQTLTYLVQTEAHMPSEGLSRLIIRRMFHAGRFEEVTRRLAALPEDQASPDLLAMGAIAGLAMNSGSAMDLGPLEAWASNAPDTPAGQLAMHWAKALDAVYGRTTPPAQVEAVLSLAIADFPRHPYMRYLHAVNQAQAGNYGEAMAACQQITEALPSWAQPWMLYASLALQQGRYPMAERPAQMATQASSSPAAGKLLALAIAGQYGDLSPARREMLASILDELERVMPRDPELALARIKLLISAGDRRSAKEAAEALLALDPLPAPLLPELRRLSELHGLNLQSAMATRVEQTDTNTLIGLTLAIEDAFSRGDANAVRALLDQGLASTSRPQPQAMLLLQAQVLERLRDPQATAIWADLVKRYPEDLTVQRAAAGSRALPAQREVWDQALQRFAALSGENNQDYRLHRARYLLAAEVPLPSRIEQALGLLEASLRQEPDRHELHYLKGLAHAQRDEPGLAASSLRRAATDLDLDPKLHPLHLDLALQFIRLSESADAQRTLNRLLAKEPVPWVQERIAWLYSKNGQAKEALTIVNRLAEAGPLNREARRLHVMLLIELAQFSPLPSATQALLEDPEAADYELALLAYTLLKNDPQLQAVKDQLLADPNLASDEAAVVLAAQALRNGEMEQALDLLHQAVEAQPDRLAYWESLLRVYLLQGRSDAGRQALAQAPSSIRGSDPLAWLESRPELVAQAEQIEGFASLMPEMLQPPVPRDVLWHAMELLVASHGLGTSTLDETQALQQAQTLDDLARRYPKSELVSVTGIAVKRQVAERLKNRDPERWRRTLHEASTLADQATRELPSSVTPPRLAALIYTELEQPREVLQATDAWKRRAPQEARQADTIAAAALRKLGRFRAAVQRLEPYTGAISSSPEPWSATARELALNAALAGNIEYAQQVLEFGKHLPAYRAAAREVAVLSNQDTAQSLAYLVSVLPEDPTAEELARSAWSGWQLHLRDPKPAVLQQTRDWTRQAIASEETESRSDVLFLLGAIQEAEGDHASARESYRAALQQSVETGDAGITAASANNLAMLLINTENHEQAIRLAQQAVELRPQEANYLDTLGQALVSAERCEEAIQAMDRARQLAPDSDAIQASYRAALEGCGQAAP